MDPADDQTELEARLRRELALYDAPIEPSQDLRSTVDRLTNKQHPTTWSRWRGPLIAAAAVAAIATLTSVVLLTRGPDTTPSTGQSAGPAQPFAPERTTPSPEVELDPPTAVSYSEGEHGNPTDEFRALGESAANALQNNDLPALSALQDPSSQQPNLMAGLIEIYGGKPVKAVEYEESSIRAFPWAAVDYTVDCPAGKDVRFSLTFNYINGRMALFPSPQEDLSKLSPDLTDGAAPSNPNTPAAVDSSPETDPPGTMRYPSCTR